MNDVIINKAEIIERALKRTRETYERHYEDLEKSFDAQDVFCLTYNALAKPPLTWRCTSFVFER